MGIANKLLNKIKQALGLEKAIITFTGAAPITVETLEYFGSLGICVCEVYGMSECCGATTWSTPATHQWGSCGFALPGHEVKCFKVDETDNNKKTECPVAQDPKAPTDAEQGEICFRGRHIMNGYLANPKLGADHVEEIKKKTADAIDTDGWLHSGDMGCQCCLFRWGVPSIPVSQYPPAGKQYPSLLRHGGLVLGCIEADYCK